jgi:heptosyltransferase-3
MKSILIVHQGAIGDFVLSLSALEALHQSYPEAYFTFLARPNILELIQARPYVKDVFDFSASRWAPLYHPRGRLAAADLERLLPVDIIFIFGRSSSQIVADNLASNLGKPAHRLDPFPKPGLGLSLVDHQCGQLEELGIPASPPPAVILAPRPQDFLEARSFVRSNMAPEESLILLHPGSGGRNKLWTPVGWVRLIHKLAVYSNLRLALLQGPADNQIVQQIRSRLDAISPIFVENWPLGKLAALMTEAALYLGNDSGITHLAAASATPTIALFGPTDLQIWAPRGPRVRIIRWKPGSSANNLQGESGKISESPPEVALVWDQVSDWLEL